MRWFAVVLPSVICLITGCVPTPTVPEDGSGTIVPGGVYVLCEGLWRQNNGALSYIAPTNATTRDVMMYVNGSRLGDNPSDMVVSGDTVIIAVNTSRKIVFVQRSSGKVRGIVSVPGGGEPYRLCLMGNRLWCTNLNDDTVTEFDLVTGLAVVSGITVGPAPEGIACTANKLFIALSGQGDLRSSEPDAGSLRILRSDDYSVITTLPNMPNAAAVIADQKRQRVWVTYRNLPSKPDAMGGVVLVDARSNAEVHRWEFQSPSRLALDTVHGDVYVLHGKGVSRLTEGVEQPALVLTHTSGAGSDTWYSLAYDSVRGLLYVGNARAFVTDGEVLVFMKDGSPVGRYPVALNPTSIAPMP